MIYLLNHLAFDGLNGMTPITAAFGQQADISALLSFHWWQPVYYSDDGKEKLGRWVGVAEKQGDALTYLVLTNDTQQVLARSNVRSASDPMFPNKRANEAASASDGGEDSTNSTNEYIYSVSDKLGVDPSSLKLPLFSPDELLGLTFLKECDDGQTVRAKVARRLKEIDKDNHEAIKFLIEVGDAEYDEILTYNELSDLIERQHEAEAKGETNVWTFKDIIGHQGPLKPSDKRYKGSSYNVLVHWEDGSETYEPLTIVMKDDPVTCARYAMDNDLLDTPGWKSLKRIASREKMFKRMLKQARLKSARRGV